MMPLLMKTTFLNSFVNCKTVVTAVYLWFLLPHGVICSSRSRATSCPRSCYCDGDDKMVVCTGDSTTTSLTFSNLGLTKVPTFEGMYASVTVLNLSGNSIAYLETGMFTDVYFPSVTELDLSENMLQNVDFLTDDSFLPRSTVYLHGNPLQCEELLDAAVLDVLCRNPRLNGDLTCTADEGLTEIMKYCNSPGTKVPVIVISVVVVIVVLVAIATIVTIAIIVCLKTSSQCCKSSDSNPRIDAKSPSHRPALPSPPHYAPPSAPFIAPPPLPSPLDIHNSKNAAADDEIYAEVNDTVLPLTATSIVSRGSVDYEDGYILKLDSVPDRTNKTFGGPVSTSTSEGYELAGMHARVGFDVEDASQSESAPIPYYAVLLPNDQLTEAEKGAALAELRKKKPPVIPRKKSLNSLGERKDIVEKGTGIEKGWGKERERTLTLPPVMPRKIRQSGGEEVRMVDLPEVTPESDRYSQ